MPVVDSRKYNSYIFTHSSHNSVTWWSHQTTVTYTNAESPAVISTHDPPNEPFVYITALERCYNVTTPLKCLLQCQLKHRCLLTSSMFHNDQCHVYKLLRTWGVTFLTSIGSCLLSCWSWEWAHPAASHQWWACDGWHVFFWCHTSILHFASLTTHKTLLQTAHWMTWECRALQIPRTKSTWHL